MKKILFIQPGYAHYRKPLFDKLNENFNITFIFLKKKIIYPSFDFGNKKWKRKYVHSNSRLLWIFELIWIILLSKIDIIISSIPNSTGTLVAFFLAKILRIKIIIWSENWNFKYEYLNRKNLYRNVRILQYKFIVNHSDALIVHGETSYRFNFNLGFSKEKIFIANHSTYDLGKREIKKDLKKYISPNNEKVILYFSRIIPRKGLDILIRAFKFLCEERKDVILIVAGGGYFKKNCKLFIKELNLSNIFFVGSVPFEKAHLYFSISDIFVLPSCARGHSEAWGLVINEAMSMAKPVITTDAVGAAYDLVKEKENGMIVKSGSPESLFEGLKEILGDNKKMLEMGHNSRKIFESFNSYDKMFEGFKKAINSVSDS